MEIQIYKLTNDINNKIYVGSTHNLLNTRMRCHRSKSKNITGRRNSKLYSHMREIGIEHFKIELIEKFNFETKEQRFIKEQYWIEKIKPELNMFNAISMNEEYYKNRIDKENLIKYRKKYYEENKELILEKTKEYQQINKEKISERKKIYRERTIEHIKEKKSIKYTCECGSILCLDKKARHEKTKKHLKHITG